MRFWRSLLLPASLLAALAATSSAQTTPTVDKPVAVPTAKPPKATEPKTPRSSLPTRRAWMFGVSPGYGATRFVGTWVPVVAELRSDTPIETPPLQVVHHNWKDTKFESAPSLQFRVGYALNPRLMIGFEQLNWFKDFDTYTWRFNSSTVSATWHPSAGHLFFRGGAGVSGLAEKVPTVNPFFLEAADRGVSLEGAVGYERLLWGRLAIAPEISARQMNFGHNIRSQIVAGSVGFNWWF